MRQLAVMILAAVLFAAPALAETLRLDAVERREVQTELTRQGYDTRGVDGVFGPGTRAAISDWQRDNGWRGTGELTAAQYDQLIFGRGGGGDDAAWSHAVAQGTPGAYRRYLDLYPDGRHAQKARNRIDRKAANADYRDAERRLGLVRDQRFEVEERLRRAGYGPGRVDGKFDRPTRDAIRAFRRDEGFVVHPFVDMSMLRRLVAVTGGNGELRRSSTGGGNDLAIGLAAGALVLGGVLLLAD